MSDAARRDAVPDPLARRVRVTPDRPALVDARDGSSWRYDALDDAVSSTAGHLAGLGLDAGDHLGVLVETSVDAVRTIHAAWRLGLAVVPVNVRLAEPELADQVQRSDLGALVCDVALVATARSVADCPIASIPGAGAAERGTADASRAGPADRGDEGAVDADGEVDVDAGDQDAVGGGDEAPVDRGDDRPGPARASSGVPPLSSVDPTPFDAAGWARDDVAVLLFTSGTTGEPKAVQLTMGNLLASATASAFRLGVRRGDRWLLCLPVYHMGGLAPVLRSSLYGTTLVVQEGFDPAAVSRATHDHDVTGLSLVPTQLQRILDEHEPSSRSPAALADSVRTILLGGAPASRSLLERCRDLDLPVCPTYGMTETASQAATATPTQAVAYPGTVGQPLLDVAVTVVDADHEPLSPGETGELVVSGPTVTPGYFGDPDAIERAFCEHGLLTGDLGHRDDDGRLWVAGRRSDRIVTGGENVDPARVSAVLADLDGVAEAAVVGLPDEAWGERVAALVVLEPGRERDAEALLAAGRERLAGFEVPKTLRFADALPRTASGTVDRQRVRDRLRG